MSFWKLWCRTLGTKISENDREADLAAILRTIFVLFNVVVGIFIIANAAHHW